MVNSSGRSSSSSSSSNSSSSSSSSSSEGKVKKTKKHSVKKTKLKEPKKNKPGIVYLASLPPFMRVEKLRHLLSQFGDVNRIYLAPEDTTERNQRKRAGGNRRQKFLEGWVEFESRKIAKRVAWSLNNTPIGGKKRNYYRDDLWNMRYLPNFKWHQLKEDEVYSRHVRKQRLSQQIAQARRENEFYLEKVDEAKTKEKIAERRAGKKKMAGEALEEKDSGEHPERSAAAPWVNPDTREPDDLHEKEKKEKKKKKKNQMMMETSSSPGGTLLAALNLISERKKKKPRSLQDSTRSGDSGSRVASSASKSAQGGDIDESVLSRLF